MGANSPTKTCTATDCDRPLRAKGLCSTHYNQQQPNRHRRVTTQCNACGQVIVTYNGADRWGRTFCSELCRSWQVWGASKAEPLPSNHWGLWWGRTSAWIAPLVRNTGECAWCGEPNDRRLTASYCSEKCSRSAHRIRRRAREFGAAGEYTWSQVARLWLTHGRSCAYCHTPTALANIEPDHVVALNRGGDFGVTNILPACKHCNSDKRDLTLSEWATDRARRRLAPVTTQWHQDDHRYRHLTSTLAA